MKEQMDNTSIARHIIYSELSEAGRHALNIELNLILIGILTNNPKKDLYDFISELKMDTTGTDNLEEMLEKIQII